MPKAFSGKQVVKILEKVYFFVVVSQEGSHVKLTRKTAQKKHITIVPLHKELAHGTLRGVLELADIDYRDFVIQARTKGKN